jgi:hypothetical protein
MPMNHRLLVPRQTLHPEALAWRAAVVANGGSVTGSQVKAVDTYVRAAYSGGYRSLLFRHNPFVGSDLAAGLVPLFRGPSQSTAYGNTTDTNVNFVGGDFTATGGLTTSGANSTKYLATGLIPFNVGLTEQNYHNSGFFPDTLNTSGDWIGSSNGGAFSIYFPAFATLGMYVRFGGGSNSGIENGTLAARNGLLLGQRSSGTGVGYRNGTNIAATSVTSGSVAFATGNPGALFVFARNNAGTPTSYFTGRSFGYSIGLPFTDAQALAFYNAWLALNTALGRS